MALYLENYKMHSRLIKKIMIEMLVNTLKKNISCCQEILSVNLNLTKKIKVYANDF